MNNTPKPLTVEEMKEASDVFFPLFDVVHKGMPTGASVEDTLKVMETVTKLAHKYRADKKASSCQEMKL